MFNRFLENFLSVFSDEPGPMPEEEIELTTIPRILNTQINFETIILNINQIILDRQPLLTLEPLPEFTPITYMPNFHQILQDQNQIRNQFFATLEQENRNYIRQYIDNMPVIHINNDLAAEFPQQEEQRQEFYADKQNTHYSEVTISINASMNRLKTKIF